MLNTDILVEGFEAYEALRSNDVSYSKDDSYTTMDQVLDSYNEYKNEKEVCY